MWNYFNPVGIIFGENRFKEVYDALKKYILSLNIYLKESDFHLDERQLSEKLGVSRTPIREAVAKLEQEGIVKTVPVSYTHLTLPTKRIV